MQTLIDITLMATIATVAIAALAAVITLVTLHRQQGKRIDDLTAAQKVHEDIPRRVAEAITGNNRTLVDHNNALKSLLGVPAAAQAQQQQQAQADQTPETADTPAEQRH